MAVEELKLDTALYIGIAVDVVLAIVAGILIYKWRKRVSERRERRRQVEGMYGVSQRTEVETIPLDSNSVSAIMDPEGSRSGYHTYNNNMRPAYSPQRSEEAVRNYEDGMGLRTSHVSFRDIADDDTPQETHYPSTSEARDIRNPLAMSASTVQDENPDNQEEDMTLSTYYTYRPPKKHLDGESSEMLSEGEKSPVALAPPSSNEYMELDDENNGSDGRSRSPAPLPSPPPGFEANEYSYIDNDGQQDSDSNAVGDRASTRSCSTANFGEDPVAKLYGTDLEESTPIM